jgi:hypothetical protein
MAEIAREWVSAEPPTSGRAGAGGRPCQGVWHRPLGRRPSTAIIATHYEVDFSEHYLAEHLAGLGYGFLGWNTRYRGNGSSFSLDRALTDIGVGVRWPRDLAGVDSVVLLGNSGGASLMAAYQVRSAELDVPRGDLFISLNADPGRPDVLTTWLDPSVVDEGDPLSVDPSLDMFNGENGPPYPPDFVNRYRRAQVARNQRITEWAGSELDRLRAGGAGERLFPLFRAWADLRFADLSIDRSERRAGCYAGEPRTANYSGNGLASANTLRSWLAMWGLTTSQCRAGPHLAGRAVVVVEDVAHLDALRDQLVPVAVEVFGRHVEVRPLGPRAGFG